MLNARAESPLVYQHVYIRHRQCAWCRLVMNGPLAGRRPPILISAYTHGACPECERAFVASRAAGKLPTAR